MKNLVLLIVLAALGLGGWYGYGQYQTLQARRAAQARAAAEQARETSAERTRAVAEQARERARQAAAAALRAEVEAQLKAMKVSSIILGQPGIAIINKKSYEEGDLLPLAGSGRQARLTAVRGDGILLACEGQAFRLDPPAEPDLAAGRKR